MRTLLLAVLGAALGFGQTTSDKDQSAERAQTILDSALKDKNPDTRKQAVEALGLGVPAEPWLSELDNMLEDKDVLVRLAAITSLVDLRNQRTVPALEKALSSSVPEVSFAAAKALWTLDDPAGREALLSVLSGETKTSSGLITRQKRDALRILHTPKAMFMLALKQGAAMAPVPGLGAGVSSLQGILSDPGISGRAATALLLSTDNSPDILQALREALSDSDGSVRAAAVHAIAVRGDSSLVADLIPLLDDKKEAVRVRAAAGVLRLQSLKTSKSTAANDAAPK